jgi:hypothetical protein
VSKAHAVRHFLISVAILLLSLLVFGGVLALFGYLGSYS